MPIILSISQSEEEDSLKNATSSDGHMHMYDGAVNPIGTISYQSEYEGKKDLKNETSDIIDKFDGLAQDLDAGITGVSTLLGSGRPVTHNTTLFLEETPVTHNNGNATGLTLNIPSQAHNDNASSDEPKAASTVHDRIGALVSPTTTCGDGPFASPGVSDFTCRVSQRSNKGVKELASSMMKY